MDDLPSGLDGIQQMNIVDFLLRGHMEPNLQTNSRHN